MADGFGLSQGVSNVSENPYTAPKSNVALPTLEPAVPAAILKKIKNAWVAGIVSGCITLAVTLLAIFGTSLLGFSAWELFDVALIFGLTFGIFKKSRTCAVLMLTYFVCSKILMMVSGHMNGLPMAVVFIYFYFQGVLGTFAYHKHKAALATVS